MRLALAVLAGMLVPFGNASAGVAPTKSTFTVAGIASPVVAGTPVSVTVTYVDPPGTLFPSPLYTGTVHFTSTDARAVLPPDYTFTLVDVTCSPG